MAFSEELWSSIEDVYNHILAHDFINELQQGTLKKERFQFYIQQDALYLQDFGKALARLAAKARTPQQLEDFAHFAEGTASVERALHREFFQQFGIEEESRKSLTCFTYTNFLLATCSNANYEVGIAAVLPCFWIYREVGNHIYANAVTDNPYQAWIDTYSGEEFSNLVDKAISITDDVASRASPDTRQEMIDAFIYSTKLEWMFWDSAYRMETWPV